MKNSFLLISLIIIALAAFAWSLMLSFGSRASSVAANSVKSDPAWVALGVQGEAPGQFQQPRGITGFPDGSFVVVDRKARIQQFSADGKPMRLWSMQEHSKGNPKGLCALPDGNLLVCDTHYGRVLEMTLDGIPVKVWGETGTAPGQFVHPLSAVADFKRSVAYVVEYGAGVDRVQKFKLDGKLIKTWGTFGDAPGEFQRPSGVAVDGDGNVYVADACNHRVQKFDGDGNVLKVFGTIGKEPGELRYPYDIACTPDGTLYVAEFNNHRVSVFNRDGTFIRTIGAAGSGDGEFANPWSLTVDARGRLLVSDTGNHRVQIFDLNRSTASTVPLTALRKDGQAEAPTQ